MIPKGLQIHITTYENDGDAKRTKIKSGLTEADILYLIELSDFFTSDRDHENLSSEGIKDINLYKILKEVGDKHPNVSENIKKELFIKEDFHKNLGKDNFYELMHDYYYYNLCDWVLSNPVDECYHMDEMFDMYCRSVDDIEVFNIPEDIEEK